MSSLTEISLQIDDVNRLIAQQRNSKEIIENDLALLEKKRRDLLTKLANTGSEMMRTNAHQP